MKLSLEMYKKKSLLEATFLQNPKLQIALTGLDWIAHNSSMFRL